jgi:hypothetical protein
MRRAFFCIPCGRRGAVPLRATLPAAVLAIALTRGAAAHAQATLGPEQNGNTKVDLKVRHMAAPDALTPPRRSRTPAPPRTRARRMRPAARSCSRAR